MFPDSADLPLFAIAFCAQWCKWDFRTTVVTCSSLVERGDGLRQEHVKELYSDNNSDSHWSLEILIRSQQVFKCFMVEILFTVEIQRKEPLFWYSRSRLLDTVNTMQWHEPSLWRTNIYKQAMKLEHHVQIITAGQHFTILEHRAIQEIFSRAQRSQTDLYQALCFWCQVSTLL